MQKKEYLEKVIYEIGQECGFLVKEKGWAVPSYGYSYNNTRKTKAMNVLMKSNIIKENRSDIICILSDWTDVAQGIYFTHKAMYSTSPKNARYTYRVSYDEIKEIETRKYSDTFTIKTFDGEEYYVGTDIWNKRNIKAFLKVASGNMSLDEEDKRILSKIDIMESSLKELESVEVGLSSNKNPGVTATRVGCRNYSNVSTEYLEKLIYEIGQVSTYKREGIYYRRNKCGFSYNDSIFPLVIESLEYHKVIKEKGSTVIGMLCEMTNFAEGYMFTDKAMYSCFSIDEEDNYSFKYEEIRNLEYKEYKEDEEYKEKLIITVENAKKYEIINPNWELRNIKAFLEVASGNMNLDEEDKKILSKIDLVKSYLKEIERIELDSNKNSGVTAAGVVYGNVSNASIIYGMDKFNTPRGHGFAAEHANHLHDKIANADFLGKGKVKLVGEDIDPSTGRIVKNGADRIVNGTNIQTKYCASGSKCISECFDNGTMRYLNPDGSPMQIEVPSDKYNAALKAMENRIKNGEVPGVSDPAKAKEIVRKGNFTYKQAKNIAKFGTVESITFDAVNGAIISTCSMGISATLTFATVIWSGEDFDVALKKAVYEGLKVGGTTFATAVLSSQLSRAGLNSALVGSSEALVTLMGPKASAMLVNAFRSGSNIYGAAAMKSAAKMLRGNAITGAVSVIVLSSVDIADIFRGRISGSQLFKNLANTASTVAGGTAGWTAGATAGATIGSVVPVVGTAVGGFVGGLLGSLAGGSVAGKVSGAVLDEIIEDDANIMLSKIENVFTQLAEDYLLNKKEAEAIVDKLKDVLSGKVLKDMYESSNRDTFAKKILKPLIEKEVKKREKIKIPSDSQLVEGLRRVLEDLSENVEVGI